MKKFDYFFIIIVLFIMAYIFGKPLTYKLYYSYYVKSEEFKTSNIETKYNLLNNKNFIQNANDDLQSEVIESLAQNIIDSDDIAEKINFLENQDFKIYGSIKTRKALLLSVIDSQNIHGDTLINFLLRVCSDKELHFIAERIEEKEYTFTLEDIDLLKYNLHLSNLELDLKIWEKTIDRSLVSIKQNFDANFNKTIRSEDFNEKISFLKSYNFINFASKEQKENLIESIFFMKNLNEDSVKDFFFKDCSKDEFTDISKIIQNKKIILDKYFIINVKSKIKNNKYGEDLIGIWNEIEHNTLTVKSEFVDKKIKELIENNHSFEEKYKMYKDKNFVNYASKEARKKLIESMIDTPNINDIKISFFLPFCRRNELQTVFDRMVKNKFVLTRELTATILVMNLLGNVKDETKYKLFDENPIAKRQIIVFSLECIEGNNFKKFQQVEENFYKYLNVDPTSQLFKEISEFNKLINESGNKSSKEIENIIKTEKPNFKNMISEHLYKVMSEYDEEIRNK